jgi:PhnB protein
MSQVSIYLNFHRSTEEAFHFYKKVFGTEFEEGRMMRFSEIPPSADMPPMPDEDKDLVMHVSLPILGGFRLMGSDAPESMGFRVNTGNNMYINLMPETRKETQKLFKALSEDGTVEQELQDMFWGDYYGSCVDKFGIRWMFNCAERAG